MADTNMQGTDTAADTTGRGAIVTYSFSSASPQATATLHITAAHTPSQQKAADGKMYLGYPVLDGRLEVMLNGQTEHFTVGPQQDPTLPNVLWATPTDGVNGQSADGLDGEGFTLAPTMGQISLGNPGQTPAQFYWTNGVSETLTLTLDQVENWPIQYH